MAAIWRPRRAGQDRQRLLHHNTADQLDLPIDLPPGVCMPECIAEREDLHPYWIPISLPGNPDFGIGVFFSRSERPINLESLSALRLLAQDIGPIIQQRNGCTSSLLDMVELSTDEIYIFEPQRFTISRTNATASVRTGYAREALTGMTPASLKVGISELDYRAKLMPLVEGTASRASPSTRSSGGGTGLSIRSRCMSGGSAAPPPTSLPRLQSQLPTSARPSGCWNRCSMPFPAGSASSTIARGS
ncbi:MAG: hypothetical protein U5N27_24600 [Rhizobium sp.]|nr:hypothetical protein [Rhizobium sp.]